MHQTIEKIHNKLFHERCNKQAVSLHRDCVLVKPLKLVILLGDLFRINIIIVLFHLTVSIWAKYKFDNICVTTFLERAMKKGGE